MLGRLVLTAVCVGTLVPAPSAAQTTEKPALMPAVVDSTMDVARRLITPHRLRIKTIPVAGPPERALVVSAQSPQPGTEITDSVATIWVNVISTRDLLNLTEREADSIIRYAGFAGRVETLEVRRITKPHATVEREQVVARKPKPKPKPQAARTSTRAAPRAPEPIEKPETAPAVIESPVVAERDSTSAIATLRDSATVQSSRAGNTTLWPWFMVAMALGAVGAGSLLNKVRRDRTLAEQLAANNENSSATVHYVIRSDGTPIFRDDHPDN
jgi:hypothetical protein